MRLSKDEYFMALAEATKQRSTCRRRSVGCVLVDNYFHIVGTGYNGVASGVPHCLDKPCIGAAAISGTALQDCEAIHAEINALIQCQNVQNIWSIYVTTSPCNICIGALLNTSAKRIVFREEYPHARARERWLESGREWVHLL